MKRTGSLSLASAHAMQASRLLYLVAALAFSLFSLSATAQQAPPDSANAKAVVALVDKAVALINAKGKAAFDEMRAKPAEWHTGGLYLFAGDMKGISVYHGASPTLEGTDTSQLKDSTGKLIVKEQLDLIKKSGKGWVHYMWPKAGETTPSQKWSYIKAFTADGMPGYIGAGFHPE